MMHNWRFVKKGGFDQVLIENGDDIASLGGLNQKLWATLSCPVSGVEFDRETLQMIDSDGDGKIRVAEILEAIRYLQEALVDIDILTQSGDSVPLALIRRDSELGAKIYDAALGVLRAIGKEQSDEITMGDIVAAKEIFASSGFNSDGVIGASAIDSDEHKAIFELLRANSLPKSDYSGEVGIDGQDVENFFEKIEKFLAWHYEFVNSSPAPFSSIIEATKGLEIYVKLAPKIDNYFVRDALIGFDENAKTAFAPETGFYREFINSDMSILQERLGDLPLSIADGSGALRLRSGVNPLYADILREFVTVWVQPSGANAGILTKDEWSRIKEAADKTSVMLKDYEEIRLVGNGAYLRKNITNLISKTTGIQLA
jgi:hypothetical protein